MDEFDRASERETKDRELCISVARANTAKSLPAAGACYNCDAPLTGEMRFCDADCREDWTARNRSNNFKPRN